MGRGVRSLQVLGDSKFIIDWAKGKIRLDNLILCSLMENFKEGKKSNLYGVLSKCV
jgi:hypothetical protein